MERTPLASPAPTLLDTSFDSSNVGHGFLYNGTTYTTLDDPLGTFTTSAFGISGSKIVGSYAEVAGVLHGFVATVPVPGDYNGNGIVDAADYTVWRDTLGSTTDLRANGDNTGASAGKIDAADYAVWKANFGNHAGSPGGAAGVPEPATQWLLLMAGSLAVLIFRKGGLHRSRVRGVQTSN